ncbi:MAG: hypothetical protein R3C55_04735 [Parvularculaceae bacterium]
MPAADSADGIGAIAETRDAANAVAGEISRALTEQGGRALIADYGYASDEIEAHAFPGRLQTQILACAFRARTRHHRPCEFRRARAPRSTQGRAPGARFRKAPFLTRLGLARVSNGFAKGKTPQKVEMLVAGPSNPRLRRWAKSSRRSASPRQTCHGAGAGFEAP